MSCPHCDHPKTKVVNSRPKDNGTWRSRRCLSCDKTFHTQESNIPLNRGVLLRYGKTDTLVAFEFERQLQETARIKLHEKSQ